MNRKLITYVICTLFASVLSYCTVSFVDYIAYGFVVSGIICAISATVNLNLAILSSLICLVLSYISGGVDGIILCSFIVLSGIVAGVFVKNKCTTVKLILIFAAGCLLSCISYICFVSSVSGTNVIVSYLNGIKPEFVEMMNQYFSAAGLDDYSAVVREFVDGYFIYIQNMIPSIFVIIALLFSFLSAIIVSIILKLSGEKHLYKLEFSRLACDKTTAIVFFISIVCSIFMKNGVLQTVFLNICVILLFVFQVCGFSLIDYFLKSKGLSSGVRVLILFACILFATTPILLFGLIIAAVMDSFKNYRNIGIDSDKGSE